MIENKPLEGKKILITRAKSQSKRFAEQLETFGGIPIIVPLITIQPASNHKVLVETIHQIQTFDWLIFTSQNGVQAFFSIIESERIPLQWLQHLKIAVVGKTTYEWVRKYGFVADVIPEGEFTAESLAEALLNKVQKNDRVLFARGDLARDVLIQSFQKRGIEIVDVVVYENKMNKKVQPQLIEEIVTRRLDVITFTSPSTVHYFMTMVKDINWRDYLKNTYFAAIGPITKQAMLQYGIHPDVIAKENTTAGLVAALVDHFQQ